MEYKTTRLVVYAPNGEIVYVTEKPKQVEGFEFVDTTVKVELITQTSHGYMVEFKDGTRKYFSGLGFIEETTPIK